MPAAKPTKVYHVPGRFLPGYRLEDHQVESQAEADELVATGLYTLTEKEANEQAFTTPATSEATDENVKKPHNTPQPAPEPEAAVAEE